VGRTAATSRGRNHDWRNRAKPAKRSRSCAVLWLPALCTAMDAGSDNGAPGTLGDVLYANPQQIIEDEGQWVALIESIAIGDQAAFRALYDRTHRLVFTQTMRITQSREIAEEVTIDVFHDVWKRASAYAPENGTVVGWIMNQARSRAIDRFRFEHRQKRTAQCLTAQAPDETDAGERLDVTTQAHRLRDALQVLTPGERQAIETAFLSDVSYSEAAARLDEPIGTIKTRIRCGLRKLREALSREANS
jgi:RNA polymerase sigma-70 factor, ECF subfamily